MPHLIELSTETKFLMDNTATYSIFDREANPHRTFAQKAIALALRPLMIAAASGKASHWFDWHYLPEADKYKGLTIPRNEKAFDVYPPNRLMYYLKNIHMSLGGWQETALIGPNPKLNDLDKLTKTGWLYGYRTFKEGKEIEEAKYSKLVNPGFTSIIILRGPRRFDAIGLNPQTLEEVSLIGMISHIRGARIQ